VGNNMGLCDFTVEISLSDIRPCYFFESLDGNKSNNNWLEFQLKLFSMKLTAAENTYTSSYKNSLSSVNRKGSMKGTSSWFLLHVSKVMNVL
jgi:hypothetical protein